jgi:putative aldouronate transport system substrate-binding protein
LKKSLGIILSLVLLLSILAGCSGNNENNASESPANDNKNTETDDAVEAPKNEVVTVKYVLPGTEPKSWPEVKKAVNEKLLADGVNVQIEHQYIDWSAWEQKLNLMLSTGENFDMFHVMNDWIQISNYIARGAVKDITAELDQYGENIKKAIPKDVLGAVTKDGKVYGIPAHWYEPSVVGVFTSNDYLLNKYGINNRPKTPQEMLDAMEELKKAAPELKTLYPLNPSHVSNVDMLHRTFDSFPFDIRDGVAMINGDGTVKNWIETEEFKQESAFFRQAYQKKLIHADVLTLKQDQIQNMITEMKYPFTMGTVSYSQVNLDQNLPGAKLDDFPLQRFNPEKGAYRFLNAKNLNAVTTNSKHPEAVVKFLNWLYANQDNYDLYMYGIEGKTYKKVNDRGLEHILDSETKYSLVPNADWMIGNLNYIRLGEISKSGRSLFQLNPDAKSFITAGFFFDPTPIKTELGNVKAVVTSDVSPIYLGVVDYEKNIKQVLDKLKAAGIDKVIAEYQKQLDDYLASDK